ncbi:hypothetical protein K0U83_16245 [bacterium]|nr:hypothetical protein [bacterium]
MHANYHQMIDRIDALVTVAGGAAMLGWLVLRRLHLCRQNKRRSYVP